jgi:hypothetical protein
MNWLSDVPRACSDLQSIATSDRYPEPILYLDCLQWRLNKAPFRHIDQIKANK